MKRFPIQKRTVALLAVLTPPLVLFVYAALRSGPLAPVPVTLAQIENKSISPALYGIGTVEARYTFKIGPIATGRLERLDVHVGEQVVAGQVLGTMDPVDLDDRIRAQDATLNRANALLDEAEARRAYAQKQARRYAQLLEARSSSEELAATKEQEFRIAEAVLNAAREEIVRVRAERAALNVQRDNLRLIAPVDGLVVARNVEPGTTVLVGQSVVEFIDPSSLWINVRFDQIHADGLVETLPAQIMLRSQGGRLRSGSVLRVEPLADSVTEETLAKVVFDVLPKPLPPVGELAEVTLELPLLPEAPVIPNAAIQRVGGKTGVWQVRDSKLRFTPIRLGAGDLNGQVQVTQGLVAGDQIVIYSEKALMPHSRVFVVDHVPGAAP